MNKELIKEVEELLKEIAETHRYSMSRIYGAYNKAYGKNETPQSCSSCLIRKRDELKKWLEAEREKLKELERSVGSTSTPVGNYEKLEAEKPTIEGENKPKRKRKEA